MRKHVRPFAADVERHLHVHGAGKPSTESQSQATGSRSRGEMVTGGAAIWGSDEQSESKCGSRRGLRGPSDDDGRIFVMYHGTSWRKWQRIRRPLTCWKGGHGWPVGVATAQGEMGSGQGEYWPV